MKNLFKKYISFLVIHILCAPSVFLSTVLFDGSFLDKLRVYIQVFLILFIPNIIYYFVNFKKEGNTKAFIKSSPYMLIPYFVAYIIGVLFNFITQ